MQPERRRETELHPERQRHNDGAENQNHADGSAVTRVMRAEVEATNLAARTYLKQTLEQPALTASRAAAG